jgi:hypothetical protein
MSLPSQEDAKETFFCRLQTDASGIFGGYQLFLPKSREMKFARSRQVRKDRKPRDFFGHKNLA